MAHYAGKTGNVYSGALLVEDCEDAWNEHVNAHVTGTADATDFKVGTKSAKFVIASAGAGELLASEVITKDLTGYDILYLWIKCSIDVAAGDLQIHLDDTGECASPLKELDIPALTHDVWTRIALPLGDASTLGSLISIGLYQVTDLADCTIWIDDVEAITQVDGIKSWSLDYVVDMLETTDFGSAGVKEFIPAGSGWSGSFDGLKDGVPLGIGSQVLLVLAETATSGQQWLGDAYVSGVHPKVSADGLVEYSYDFQGTGELQIATI